jgi:hypothetical protein
LTLLGRGIVGAPQNDAGRAVMVGRPLRVDRVDGARLRVRAVDAAP